MKRVAITGSVATGKSTVLAAVRGAGGTTASADEIAREVFNEPEIQRALATIARTDAPPDASELRRLIGADVLVRREVNALTHPEILDRLASSGAQFFEVPLLIETCIQRLFDEVWVVVCDPQVQLSRLVARVGDEVQARALIGAQLHLDVKCAFADRIVRTNDDLDTVKEYVRKMALRIIG